MRLTGVITQGAKRIGSPEYIKSYKIAYSNDGKSWVTYKVKGTNEDMKPKRGEERKDQYPSMSILICSHSKSHGIWPPDFSRQSLLSSPEEATPPPSYNIYSLHLAAGCSEPLGMKSGHIQDYQITASSIFRTLNMDMFTWEPRKARLDKQGKVNAWTSGHSDQSQWLQLRTPGPLLPVVAWSSKAPRQQLRAPEVDDSSGASTAHGGSEMWGPSNSRQLRALEVDDRSRALAWSCGAPAAVSFDSAAPGYGAQAEVENVTEVSESYRIPDFHDLCDKILSLIMSHPTKIDGITSLLKLFMYLLTLLNWGLNFTQHLCRHMST
ncbi:EGF-like repeat and discoidin I-like domain-containing protein 3 [Chelonia mydas]|uniref:EGF-like repeat and discoidin I-like domain-containing protein 3 n=1 Tax=Chelonia mydas TaxID=8469 RepID=M7BFC4_CHEMY|nr:EGF-like repeat and discoidin I-like domain-containing protein 3 [Chelonia mydas]